MQKWEYLIAKWVTEFGSGARSLYINHRRQSLEDEPRLLSRLGQEGWELVGITDDSGSTSDVMTYVFKRPITAPRG
jgi:hypothetical protein